MHCFDGVKFVQIGKICTNNVVDILVKKAPKFPAALRDLAEAYCVPDPPKLEDLFSVEKFISVGYHTPPDGVPPVETTVLMGEGVLFEMTLEADAEGNAEAEAKTSNDLCSGTMAIAKISSS